MKCPMGSADGVDATCSGTNGFCVPKDASDIFEDKSRQDAAGEYDRMFITNYPPWMTGPATVQGMCECIVGSGEACELRCTTNNNGTYGPLHLNQFGICDTYIAITKPLPPCSRYNSMGLTDQGDLVPSNSTTYDRSRIINPERLMFCSDQDMIDGAAITAYDNSKGFSTDELEYRWYGIANSSGVLDEEAETTFEQHAKDATRVFQKICFPHPNDNIFRFEITKDTNMRYTEGPKYNEEKWAIVKEISDKTPYGPPGEIKFDVEQLWIDAITDEWIEQRLSDPIAGYYAPYSYYFADKTVNECAWLAMRNYERSMGIFYIKNNGCFLQNATRVLTEAQLVAGESPMPPEPQVADSSVFTYIIDVEEIPLELRPLKRPITSRGPRGRSRVGIRVSIEPVIDLWFEEMQPGAQSMEVTASTDDGATAAHIISYGVAPFNRIQPGLILIGEHTTIMFGGRLIFLEGEDDEGNIITSFEDSNDVVRIDSNTFTFSGQSIVSVSYSIPEIDETTLPSARANPVMAYDGGNFIYMFGGSTVSYNALGEMTTAAAPPELWALDISIQDSQTEGQTARDGWAWTFMKAIDYGHFDPLVSSRVIAWADETKIYMEDGECWIGPQTQAPNVCSGDTPHVCADEKPEACAVSTNNVMAPVTMNCQLKIKMQMPPPDEGVGRQIMLGDEQRPIAKWEIPFDEFKYWDLFKIWYHDWRMIDPDFGSDFLTRYRNIFHLQMVQNLKEDKYKLSEAIPRTPRYVKNGTTAFPAPVGIIASGISIDECKYKCDLDYACPAFDYDDDTGDCILGSGRYVRSSFLGATLKQSDKYRLNFEEAGVIEKVNRYIKRAIMMQGRYSVLNELGTNIVTDPWQGFDWMIHREMGPSKFTHVPSSDGSRNIAMMCSSGNCKRSGAVAFQKATYTRKEANAICGVMDPENCGSPCERTFRATYQTFTDTNCVGGTQLWTGITDTTLDCAVTCDETAGCMAYTIYATDTIVCTLYDKCETYLVSDDTVGMKTHAKTPYCRVSAFTEPSMYYMIDFSAPGIPQTEKYRLTQGRKDYTVTVNWVYDENKNFDSHSLNPDGRPWVMDGRQITVNVGNSMGLEVYGSYGQ